MSETTVKRYHVMWTGYMRTAIDGDYVTFTDYDTLRERCERAETIANDNALQAAELAKRCERAEAAIEDSAAQRAYHAGLGVSEWRAFLTGKERTVIEARDALATAGEKVT